MAKFIPIFHYLTSCTFLEGLYGCGMKRLPNPLIAVLHLQAVYENQTKFLSEGVLIDILESEFKVLILKD